VAGLETTAQNSMASHLGTAARPSILMTATSPAVTRTDRSRGSPVRASMPGRSSGPERRTLTLRQHMPQATLVESTTFVTLLRGINVGQARQVAMADLRAIAEGLGYGDVRTLLRSGNLVVSTAEPDPAQVAGELERAIKASLGMTVGVVVRRADEMDAVVRANPMAGMAVGSRLHVVFLAEPLADDVRAWLASEDFTPDSVSPAEREVYVWYEHGMSGSSTADRISRRLPRNATDRNWNTVTKLLAMATEQPGGTSPGP